MFFEGTFVTKVPKEKVWAFISDPKSVAKCIPDLKNLEVQSEDKFTAKFKLGIGWIKGDFDFNFTITEVIPQSHAKLLAHGSGVKSQIDLDITIDLTSTPDNGTTLLWKANAIISGLLAEVGQRLINSAAERIVTQLFEKLRNELEK